ncbi:S41 family peptidase [Mucilaginibacter agri]|uniref:PDZ domain-containing protein n=1 Tax=Mucilaginibacter agri TaxID=2695265 RepID=A0A966DU19_9SPHI|nr:S41 family peptidase [Mucilaginibacter agri]NCD69234.1 PDZ domain-containing protein [Mucilaginibacter agri]
MKHAASVIFRTVIILLAGITIGMLINGQGYVARRVAGKYKIDSALRYIKQHYVDTVNADTIEVKAISKVLEELDPHSVYLPKQLAQSVHERLEGRFNGIGIEYVLLRDTMFITQVYPGSPAAKAGIINGDRVITVNYKKASGLKLGTDSINHLIRGTVGNKVEMSVMHLESKKVNRYMLARGHVPLSSLDAAYQLTPLAGYIKLSKFATTTDSDFRASLTDLQKRGVKKLIVDLRGNRGGYLDAATALADEFLIKDKLIVYTQGAHESRVNYYSSNSGLFQEGKVAVLIDEYSASASEIVAGALQDLDRAVIVGRRSYGKGLVQQQFSFDDGSALNLTVARYYTPSGRSIQKSYKNGVEDYRNEINNRQQKGELTSANKNMVDSTFKTHAYYTQAGRKVYGGGGIMPDIFVPEDTTANIKLIGELAHAQIFTAYVIDHLQPSLSKYPTQQSFIKQFNVTDGQLDDFLLYASQTIKEMDSTEIRQARPHLKQYIKAFAARFKWGDNAYFEVMNLDDNGIRKALAAIN